MCVCVCVCVRACVRVSLCVKSSADGTHLAKGLMRETDSNLNTC